jgi:hypothetical protein
VRVSEEVERVAEATLAAGLRFGGGGLGIPRDTSLPIPSDESYAQHARLGSTAVLIARRFGREDERGDTLLESVQALRRRLAEWVTSALSEIARAHHELLRATAAAPAW